MPDLSRARLQDLIKSGDALLNGKASKPSYELRAGDRIVLTIPEPASTEVVAQDIPIDVLYEDADLIVINKASGLFLKRPEAASCKSVGQGCSNALQRSATLVTVGVSPRPLGGEKSAPKGRPQCSSFAQRVSPIRGC